MRTRVACCHWPPFLQAHMAALANEGVVARLNECCAHSLWPPSLQALAAAGSVAGDARAATGRLSHGPHSPANAALPPFPPVPSPPGSSTDGARVPGVWIPRDPGTEADGVAVKSTDARRARTQEGNADVNNQTDSS